MLPWLRWTHGFRSEGCASSSVSRLCSTTRLSILDILKASATKQNLPIFVTPSFNLTITIIISFNMERLNKTSQPDQSSYDSNVTLASNAEIPSQTQVPQRPTLHYAPIAPMNYHRPSDTFDGNQYASAPQRIQDPHFSHRISQSVSADTRNRNEYSSFDINTPRNIAKPPNTFDNIHLQQVSNNGSSWTSGLAPPDTMIDRKTDGSIQRQSKSRRKTSTAACDRCRVKRVRCDRGGKGESSICKLCQDLNLDCTGRTLPKLSTRGVSFQTTEIDEYVYKLVNEALEQKQREDFVDSGMRKQDHDVQLEEIANRLRNLELKYDKIELDFKMMKDQLQAMEHSYSSTNKL